jgi:hypothetical protein
MPDRDRVEYRGQAGEYRAEHRAEGHRGKDPEREVAVQKGQAFTRRGVQQQLLTSEMRAASSDRRSDDSE